MAEVVASGNPEFEKGELVVGMITWGEYCVLKGEYMLRKLDPMGFPLSYHVGIFGNLPHLYDISYVKESEIFTNFQPWP